MSPRRTARAAGGGCPARVMWLTVAALALSPTAGAAQPAPPTDLQAEPISGSRIDLTWTASSGPFLSGYRIYRDGALVGVSSDTFHSDTGLQPWTEYVYTVTAVNIFGTESAPSTPATARTLDETAPSTPRDLTGTAVSPFQIDLDWTGAVDPESGISGYVVYRDGSPIATTAAPGYSDTGLEPNTRYVYRVSAVNGAGTEGNKSGREGVRTLPLSPPPPPTALAAEAVSPTEIDLTWAPPDGGGTAIVEYRIYRDGAFVAATAQTSYRDTGLEPATTYEYRVTAVDADGLESDPSDPASATTPREPDITPPPAPQDLNALPIGPSQIDLAWSPVEDPESGVGEYLVYRDDRNVGSATVPAFSDTGLAPSTTYRYRVTAVNGDGLEGEPSSEVSATTPEPPDGTPPTAPDDVQAQAVSESQIDLSWTAAEDPESGISSYNLYRDGTFVGSTSGTAFLDTGLAPGTTYTYAVAAVNGQGAEGPRSDSVQATTFPPADQIPPAPPTGLRVVAP